MGHIPCFKNGKNVTNSPRLCGLNINCNEQWDIFHTDLGLDSQYSTILYISIAGKQTCPLRDGKCVLLVLHLLYYSLLTLMMQICGMSNYGIEIFDI